MPPAGTSDPCPGTGIAHWFAGGFPIMPTIIQQIQARREALGLSRAEAARRADITREAWSRYERGRKWPNLRTLVRMLAGLDCRLLVVEKATAQKLGSGNSDANDVSV